MVGEITLEEWGDKYRPEIVSKDERVKGEADTFCGMKGFGL